MAWWHPARSPTYVEQRSSRCIPAHRNKSELSSQCMDGLGFRPISQLTLQFASQQPPATATSLPVSISSNMVSTSSLFIASAAIVAASLVQHADAHTNMAFPVPKWPPNFYNGNSPYARMDSTKLPGTDGIPGYQGVKKIAAAMEASTDKTLRALIYKYATTTDDIECGKTLLDGPKQPVPAEIDFPWGHPGPCEAWCDDVKIFADGDCQGNSVGKIKVDQSKCTNAKRLQVMYAGVHVENYEIYSNCVPLTGSGSGSSSSTPAKTPATGATPAKTPATGATPAKTTKPAATSAPATTSAPAASTPKTKCKRRLR